MILKEEEQMFLIVSDLKKMQTAFIFKIIAVHGNAA